MTEDEKKVAQQLVGLYKVVGLQQETLAKMTVHLLALIAVVQEASPQFAAALSAHEAGAANTPTVRGLNESMRLINVSIQALQDTYGPWDN